MKGSSKNWSVPGVERIQMVRNRDIKGVLERDPALRETVEKRVGGHSSGME